MTKENHATVVLSFTHGDNTATIATDGNRHVAQEFELITEHATLSKAIAYLEAKGYDIDTEAIREV